MVVREIGETRNDPTRISRAMDVVIDTDSVVAAMWRSLARIANIVEIKDERACQRTENKDIPEN